VPVERARQIAVTADAVFVAFTLCLAAALRSPRDKTGRDAGRGADADAAAVSARTGSRCLVLAAMATSAIDVLWVWLAGVGSLKLAAATQMYAYFVLVIFCSADLNPRSDSILCAILEKEEKEAEERRKRRERGEAVEEKDAVSISKSIRTICFLPDAFWDVPFERDLYFSLRSAIADDAKETAEQEESPPEMKSESRLVPAEADHAYDSEGESVYAPAGGATEAVYGAGGQKESYGLAAGPAEPYGAPRRTDWTRSRPD